MPSIPRQDWYEKAAEAIVRHDRTLFQWANENNMGITSTECNNISRTKEFMAALRACRNRYYKELANDPSRNRAAAVGRLLHIIDKLIEVQQFDKASSALVQLLKAEGWSNEQTNVNINEVTGKDIEALRAKVAASKKTEAWPN
jgi:hypothetical protein